MKLRQKLAVVLASAMVVTAVPVVTMAASTNSLTKETIHVAKNETTTTNAVKVDFKDSEIGNQEVFYLQLENAEWDFSKLVAADGTVSGNVVTFTNGTKYEKQSETIVKVTAKVDADKNMQFPIMAKATGGDAKVSIVTKGGNTTVSNGTFVFATTSDATAVVTAQTTELPTVYTEESKIGDIMITESMRDAFASLKGDDRKIEITIDNADYEFKNVGKVEYAYGFAGQGNAESKVSVEINTEDRQTLVVTLPNDLNSDSIGQIKLTGVTVKATTKTPETGDLTVSIDGDSVKATESLKVAKIASYGSEITVAKDDAVEIKAGSQKEVKFTLAETEKGSFINNREVEFKLDKGFFIEGVKTDADEAKAKTKLADLVTVKNVTEDNEEMAIQDVIVENEKVVGFTVKMFADSKLDEIEVTAKITAGLQEDGDVTVTASGRALEKEVSAVITKINKAFSVNTEAAVLKVGLQGQTAGKVTLTEEEKGMFATGKNIVIEIATTSGITITDVPEVKVTTGDMQVGEVKLDKTTNGVVKVVVPVKRASKTASTIEIAGIEFTTDRTVAQGSFDAVLSGTALSTTEQTLDLDKFIVVGTPNTEDINGSNGLAKGTSKFVIGENKYTINGVEKEMDARSYVQDPGFTMVPMRYVAEAFGVNGNNILFSKGVTTIFAGNRTIQLTNNSDVAVVNGVQVKMATKVVIKEGRTYAPIGEVAQLLGVSKAWDNTTKTATFTN